MTGEQYLRALRDHWRVVIAALAVGLVVAGLALLVVPEKYSASVDAFVLPSGATPDATSAYQGGLLSEQRVKSYVQLFDGGRVSDLVVARLNLPMSPDDLTKKITVSAQTDTVILSISVVDPSPQQAVLLANTAADAFRTLVSQLEQPPDPRVPPATSIKLVAPARLADGAVSPDPKLYLTAGAALGLLVGIALAVRRNARGRPVRSVEDIARVVPAPSLGTTVERPPGGSALAALDRASPDAEAFRQLRTGLQFADVDHPRKLVIVTSAVENEGKTTTICNLAAVIAAAGHSVLLVDADLRRPGAAALLGLEADVGLSTALMGRLVPEEVIRSHRAGFDFLSTGPLPPNPSELTASEAMATLFTRLRERYEYVLVDSAPLLPVTDTAALAGLADGVLLVCRYGRTLDIEIRDAATTLATVRASLWGTVLSIVPRRSGSRRYGYGLVPDADAASPPTPRRGAGSPAGASPRPRGTDEEPTTSLPARAAPRPSRRPSPSRRH